MSSPAAAEPEDNEVAPPLGAGRFRLRDILGQGATATVFRAWDEERGEECAVKVLSAAARADRVTLARFEREARLLAQVEHPALLRARASALSGEHPYLVLDLAPGGNLRERMQGGAQARGSGGMEPAAAVRLLLPVLDALERVHAAGIVHRDIKPENILIGDDDQALLADFGVAQFDLEATLTAAGDRLGSFAYMAPEQLDGRGAVGPPADLYAIGATLLALTSGRPPFGLLEPERRAALLDSLPPSYRSVVARATSARPEDRPASAAALQAELRALLDPAPQRPAHRKAGGRRALGAGLCLFSLLGLTLGLGWRATANGPMGAPGPESARVDILEPPRGAASVERPSPTTSADPEPRMTESPSEPFSAAAGEPAGPSSPPRRALTPVSEDPVEETPSPPAPGTLAINSRPWSEVTLDGKPQKRSPWVGPISAGPHQLELQAADGRSFSRSIEMEPGGSIALCWDFDAEAPCPR